jgi:NAD(P)H-dependent flavin oxidoreductase YrpB (nitropropane dioxygenase family)
MDQELTISTPDSTSHPRIIQGGMGIGVSGWTLARAVSMRGQLGVVSGTAIDSVLVRRLQDGDPGGDIRRAMAGFPLPRAVESAVRRYFIPGGRGAGVPYRLLPMYKQFVSPSRQQLTMLAAFVEVFLAKEGHHRPIGINLLTKVQMPNLATLYGAMLAGVDYVLMGAGIPREIPGVLDALAEHRAASLKLDVVGLPSGVSESLSFDPREHLTDAVGSLPRPRFIAIVSAHSLAATLARKANGRVDGFVVEAPTAGGHNAPPRGEPSFNLRGEPIYGERDLVDFEKIRELGLPFWMAGGAGSPDALHAALTAGAAGVQVGTLFAYCDESGLPAAVRASVLAGVRRGNVRILTDPRASPTGYPFKIVELDDAASQDERRMRVCDLGYLRVPYRTTTTTLGYRCPAEPVDAYVAKGGDVADTVGRRCLCNGLMANIGHPQRRAYGDERMLLTSGDDLTSLGAFLGDRERYTAADVIDYLLTEVAV